MNPYTTHGWRPISATIQPAVEVHHRVKATEQDGHIGHGAQGRTMHEVLLRADSSGVRQLSSWISR